MKTLCKALIAAAVGSMAFGASAQDQWIHVYCHPKNDQQFDPENPAKGTGVFYSMPMNVVDSIRFTSTTSVAGKFNRLRVFSEAEKNLTVAVSNIRKWAIGPNVATFRITTTLDPELAEVESKTDYLDATLTIDGYGVEADFAGDVKVRGRGNSTWNYPKKAYRLKLPVKDKLCGFRKAKNYVLLANYIDPSMMRNEAACLVNQYVGMPYPIHAKPVDVYFNNNLKGSYMLMEKVGFNNGSVDLTPEQEAQSIMFELDTNYDEELRQSSESFRLPVMLKDPDAPLDPAEAKIWFAEWMADFNEMERAVCSGKGIADHIDYPTLAKYLIVYNLTCNQELNHPKSVYLYKTKGGKYHFGPCWDFDWAFGYEPTYRTEKDGGEIDEATARAMIDEVKQYMNDNGLMVEYIWFSFKGQNFVWLGGDKFMCQGADGNWNSNWPYGAKTYVPSYENFLLGYGRNNQNTADGMGNGGEFFLSIIMNNPEFMAEYKRQWEAFKLRLPEFWAEFDAYARALEPSAERNTTVWRTAYSAAVDTEFADFEATPRGAAQVLRSWLEKRIAFIDNEAANFGLYDPNTRYVPASAKH